MDSYITFINRQDVGNEFSTSPSVEDTVTEAVKELRCVYANCFSLGDYESEVYGNILTQVKSLLEEKFLFSSRKGETCDFLDFLETDCIDEEIKIEDGIVDYFKEEWAVGGYWIMKNVE